MIYYILIIDSIHTYVIYGAFLDISALWCESLILCTVYFATSNFDVGIEINMGATTIIIESKTLEHRSRTALGTTEY